MSDTSSTTGNETLDYSSSDDDTVIHEILCSREQIDDSQTPLESAGGHNDHLEIRVPNLTFPLSQYSGWEPPYPLTDEEVVVRSLLETSGVKNKKYADDNFLSLDLDDFTIYRGPSQASPNEMALLSEVATKQGDQTYFFDGILSDGLSDPKFLRNIPFKFVSTGGYQDIQQHTVGSDIWIQSVYGRNISHIWYHLLNPSAVYKPYHTAFTWLADFAKHFVDFLSQHTAVELDHFRAYFSSWLHKIHGGDCAFETWFSQYGKPDFRQAVAVHSDYLFKQALDIDLKYKSQQVWSEINLTQSIVKRKIERIKRTVVTPYIYNCFKDMEWGSYLQPVHSTQAVLSKRQVRLEKLGFNPIRSEIPVISVEQDLVSAPVLRGKREIRPGDVVAVKQDEITVWRSDDAKALWYALVQRIHRDRNNRIWLYVIWLYRPTDTICANMFYPHNDELFLSDHCNCRDKKIENTEVLAVPKVAFFSSQKGEEDFFVRQAYCTEEEVFVTLNQNDFYCSHRKTPVPQSTSFLPGTTVLVKAGSILEPAEIVKYWENCTVEIRILLRRGRDFQDYRCRPNELIYTNRTRTVHVKQIQRKCYIRFYTEAERDCGLIPPPYNRDGNGDSFYITSREENKTCSSLKPIDPTSPPSSLKQGFDPSDAKRKLRALNLFSGGGNFDRGLEEGTAIENEWAIDWEQSAILTYAANCKNPEKVKLFLGSVNDFLYQSIQHKGGDSIARIGEVEFISAGSPCQGYANTNNYRLGENALRNCSMIASAAAYIDHFRPEYAVLENVTTMARRSVKNPLSQMLCALVGMGYQARILNLDAWSFGAPQSRSRLFIFVAAPGLKLPDHPPLTHSHPSNVKNKSLGEAANGLPFGSRRWDIPVFDYVTAAKATEDLPPLESTGLICISKPNHRPSRNKRPDIQARIESIPLYPRGQGLRDIVLRNGASSHLISTNLKNKIHDTTKKLISWSRVYPQGLIPTITTAIRPECAFTGRALHWEQPRLLTIMEAGRAQGFPDHEVLIGKPAQQWRVVGNSVTRQVALALGMVLRDACLANELDNATNTFVEMDKSEDGPVMNHTAAENHRSRSQLFSNPSALSERNTTPVRVRGALSSSGKHFTEKPEPQHILCSKTSIKETSRKTRTIVTRGYSGTIQLTQNAKCDDGKVETRSKYGGKKIIAKRIHKRRGDEVEMGEETMVTTTRRKRVRRMVIDDDNDK